MCTTIDALTLLAVNTDDGDNNLWNHSTPHKSIAHFFMCLSAANQSNKSIYVT